MDYKEADELNKKFKQYLTDKGQSTEISELRKSINPVLNNPYVDDMSSIFSDWQGHAAVSMKRALVSISALTVIQLFILGEAFTAQLNMFGIQPNGDNYLRVKIVIIFSLVVSGALYISAVLRDKKNRDFKAYQLRDSLNTFTKLYNKLNEHYESFVCENDNLKKDFRTAVIGKQGIASVSEKFRKAELYKDKYEQFLQPSQKHQRILDIYDLYLIPIFGFITIGLVIAA